MIEFLQENREKILPLMVSVVFHLMVFLVVDEYFRFDFKLPEKEPEYVFVEPIVLKREKHGSIEDDLTKLEREVDTIKEKEKTTSKEIPEKKEIIPENEVSKVLFEEEKTKNDSLKDTKSNIKIEDNFRQNMVQSDIIKPDSHKALIDQEKVVLTDTIVPPKLNVKKDQIDISDTFSQKEETFAKKEEKTVSEIPDNVNIEIESFNKEIREVPRLISYSKPQYPEWAIEAEYQGYIKFKLAVNENGSVESLVKYRSDLPSEMIAYTAEYVRKWVFRPLIINKEPVKSEILVTIVFRLEVQ